MWQRIAWPSPAGMSGGSRCSQTAPILRGQRVWNTHPPGRFSALGSSPSSRIRFVSRPSRLGFADSSASVYG